jgi:hypothetical protein
VRRLISSKNLQTQHSSVLRMNRVLYWLGLFGLVMIGLEFLLLAEVLLKNQHFFLFLTF